MPFSRYVALGDSSTEGLDDPRGDGTYRGWADRFAEYIAVSQRDVQPLHYANLAVRGRQTHEILNEQLEHALQLKPDIATVFSGTNDIIRKEFNLASVLNDIRIMQQTLRDCGATVLTITMPDLSAVMPMAARFRRRLEDFNAGVREISGATGTLVVDLASHRVASDPRLWSEDRLHANSLGHQRIAQALAYAVGLAGHGTDWADPLQPMEPSSLLTRLHSEVAWTRRFLLPWLWRRITGRSSGDGIVAKRPQLEPVRLEMENT